MAEQPLIRKELEELLSGQTKAILDAVDERLEQTEGRLERMDRRIEGLQREMELRFTALEARMDAFEKKLDDLVSTLDAFLKRMTTVEDEFEALRYEQRRMKEFLKEKLGYAE